MVLGSLDFCPEEINFEFYFGYELWLNNLDFFFLFIVFCLSVILAKFKTFLHYERITTLNVPHKPT